MAVIPPVLLHSDFGMQEPASGGAFLLFILGPVGAQIQCTINLC